MTTLQEETNEIVRGESDRLNKALYHKELR